MAWCRSAGRATTMSSSSPNAMDVRRAGSRYRSWSRGISPSTPPLVPVPPAGGSALGDSRISILEGVIIPWGEPQGYLRKIVLPAIARAFKFDLNAPWGELPKPVRDTILGGDGGKKKGEYEWEGVLANIERRYAETDSDTVRAELEAYMVAVPCP